jgi:hypothetical protein
LKKVQKEDFGAALRELRLILGTRHKAMSGDRFSELCGIAPGTLNAAETGRRNLNEVDKRRIENRLGAVWNSRRGRWVYRFDQTRAYTKAVYDEYKRAIMIDEYTREYDVDMACVALFYLLRRLPKIDYHQAILDFYEQLEKWALAYNTPPDVHEFLTLMKPEINLGYIDPEEDQYSGNEQVHLSIEYPNSIRALTEYLDLKRRPENLDDPLVNWEIDERILQGTPSEGKETNFPAPDGNKSQNAAAASLETRPK